MDIDDYVEFGKFVKALSEDQGLASEQKIRAELVKRNAPISSNTTLKVVFDQEDEFHLRIPSKEKIKDGIMTMRKWGVPASGIYDLPEEIKKKTADDQVMYILGRYVLGSCGA